MKAIIHIGMPKTGSTSIQNWLDSNNAALEGESVRLFGCQGTDERHALQFAAYQVALNELGVDEKTAWMFRRKVSPKWNRKVYESYKFLSGKLKRLSGEADIYICSNEMLYRCSEIQIIALDKFLSQFFDERYYVAYIRNTVDLFLSRYWEDIQSFIDYSTQEYSGFLKYCSKVLDPCGTASSFGHLFNWEKVLGDKFNVRLLESDWLVKGDLIDDFASLLGVQT